MIQFPLLFKMHDHHLQQIHNRNQFSMIRMTVLGTLTRLLTTCYLVASSSHCHWPTTQVESYRRVSRDARNTNANTTGHSMAPRHSLSKEQAVHLIIGHNSSWVSVKANTVNIACSTTIARYSSHYWVHPEWEPQENFCSKCTRHCGTFGRE